MKNSSNPLRSPETSRKADQYCDEWKNIKPHISHFSPSSSVRRWISELKSRLVVVFFSQASILFCLPICLSRHRRRFNNSFLFLSFMTQYFSCLWHCLKPSLAKSSIDASRVSMGWRYAMLLNDKERMGEEKKLSHKLIWKMFYDFTIFRLSSPPKWCYFSHELV